MLLAGAREAAAQTEEQRVRLIQRAFEVLHREQYDSALAFCAELRALAPADPAGDVLAASVYQAMMRVYRMRIFEAELDSLSRRGEQLAQKHARKANTAEAWFMLGSAKGNLALQRFNRGEWAGGLQDALHALNAMKQARQRDRDFLDPDVALGLYEYWKSKKLGMGTRLFAGGRKEALHMLEAAQAQSRYIAREAEMSLQDLYMHEGEYDRALATNESLLSRLPLNGSVLYHRGVLLERVGREAEALLVWEKLYERIQAFRRPCESFLAECRLHRARLLINQKAEPEKILAALDSAAEHMQRCNRKVEMAGPFESFDDMNKAIRALQAQYPKKSSPATGAEKL